MLRGPKRDRHVSDQVEIEAQPVCFGTWISCAQQTKNTSFLTTQ